MKRTKKQKIASTNRRVNTQLTYKFGGSYNQTLKKENANTTTGYSDLGSTKKDLYKSLIIATLILISLMVIYWVS